MFKKMKRQIRGVNTGESSYSESQKEKKKLKEKQTKTENDIKKNIYKTKDGIKTRTLIALGYDRANRTFLIKARRKKR